MDSEITQAAWFYRFWNWAEARRKHILFGVVVLTAAGVIAAFVAWRKSEKEAAANAALAQMTSRATSAPGTGATPENLLILASNYRNSQGGARALLLAATGLFTAGKYAEAETQFKNYLRDYPQSPFTGQALLGVATSLDAQGKTNDAVTAYLAAAERRQPDMIAAQAKVGAARLYEAQSKIEDAFELYSDVARNSPTSTSPGSEAALRRQELLARHPGLVQTNRAVMTAPGTNTVTGP